MPRLVLSRTHFWQTLRLVGACALAYEAAVFAGLPEHYWALITTVVVLQPMFADTLAAGRDRILGTLIGAAVGFLVLEMAHHGLPLLPLFWTALVPLALLVAVFPYLRLAAVTLIVVVLVPGSGAPYARPFDRVVEILLGTLASILVAALLRPKLPTAPEVTPAIE
jgi:uncharacterized membrane protein YccC